MGRAALNCPYCGGLVPSDTTVCPDCHEDLAALVRLELLHAMYYNEALALARHGDFEAARRKAMVAIELKPEFHLAYLLLAKVAAAQGDWREAKRNAARAHALAPQDIKARKLLADVEQMALQAQRLAGSEKSQPRSALSRLFGRD